MNNIYIYIYEKSPIITHNKNTKYNMNANKYQNWMYASLEWNKNI